MNDIGIVMPALAAGALILLSHLPLGMRVLARGIVFIDLAIAQLAGLGAMLAVASSIDLPFASELGAAAMALMGALILTYTERRWPERQEALIGVAFVLAASLSMLVLAGRPHADEELRGVLAGQILWLGWRDVCVIAIATSALAILAWLGRKRAGGPGFYILFALAVTMSVRYIGVFLVFASLIIPALVANGRSRRVVPAYLTGLTAYATGLMLSVYTDLPAVPLIVVAMSVLALLSAVDALRRRT